MKRRDFALSVLRSLMPLVHMARCLGHGLMWLALLGTRKIFQLRYQTGYASLVLLERSHLRSLLTGASFIVYRMRRGSANPRSKPVATTKIQSLAYRR